MNLTSLRLICDAATPGPWRAGADTIDQTCEPRAEVVGLLEEHDAGFMRYSALSLRSNDADFIAAFNPATAKLLLAVVEAAQNEAIRYNEAYCNRAECEQMTDGWATLDAALAALEDAP